MAEKANELSGWKDANCLDTLAAASAEAGDFDAAIKWQQKAIDLKSNDAEFVKRAKQRLASTKTTSRIAKSRVRLHSEETPSCLHSTSRQWRDT